jgi:hypothetical protein
LNVVRKKNKRLLAYFSDVFSHFYVVVKKAKGRQSAIGIKCPNNVNRYILHFSCTRD